MALNEILSAELLRRSDLFGEFTLDVFFCTMNNSVLDEVLLCFAVFSDLETCLFGGIMMCRENGHTMKTPILSPATATP